SGGGAAFQVRSPGRPARCDPSRRDFAGRPLVKPESLLQRPKLARGARYRWDRVRGQHHLVFPEGILVLNETGAAVVRLCDGRLLENVFAGLMESFGEDFSREEAVE